MLEIPQAIAAFQAAVDLDDTYAAAHAGLALALCAQAEFRVAPPAASYPAAKAAALRALALDPTCADAQVALTAVLFFGEWDWTGARRSVERALESAPHHTEALLLYGRILEASGKLQPGLQMKLRALERDPFSASVHLQISISYWNQRNYNEAVQWADRALALDPHHPHAREHLAAAYLKKGDFERHLAENIKHAETHGIPAAALEPLVQAYKTGGRPQALRYILEHFSKAPDGGPAILMAVHYGEAGDVDAAFQHLERAIDSRDPALVHLAIAPQWDSLRADPRFEDCLARMGLGPSRAATLKSSCG
jgi:tetratricopeptide (TPR) repeat protein